MHPSITPHLRFFTLAAFTGLTAVSSALELKTGEKGIHINAGSLGGFELAYPVFSDGGKEVHKLVEARASGPQATLKYEGGGEIAVSTDGTGGVTLTFSGTPADVKSFSTTMLIDISFGRGGKWNAGGKEGVFPKDKASPAHFFSGNVDTVAISNGAGDKLDVKLPEYTFVQLTDNREWNWPIYALRSFVNVSPGMTTAKFRFAVTKGSGETKVIDTYGQSMIEDWPGKIKSEEDLKSDAVKEQAYYDGLQTPALDTYGGLPGSMQALGLKKTGFFHIENKGGKPLLVDPEGNLFFHTGICGFQPSDDYTYIAGRENIYSWLPKGDPAFATAYRKDDNTAFSFYVANIIRKYGQPYDAETFATRMVDRVRKFGFNSIGAFSAIPSATVKAKNFPYVATLPINPWDTGIKTVPGAHEVWDPFDEKTRSIIEKTLAEKLPARVDDPLLIGYFVVNEPRYDELPHVIPGLNGDQACKRKFLDFLKTKYKDISAYNAAWKADATSFDELVPKGLAVTTDAAKADTKAFTGVFLEELFKLVETNFRKHDKNHMLIGYRLQPVTIRDQQLCGIMGRYVDVNSYNYYTHEVDKEELKRIHQWTGGKPIMLSEFFWSSPKDSGLSGGRQVLGQQERGLIYRNYIEQSASLGFVIGVEWFTLIDQAATGRWFSKYSGESANTGIFSVADRPWRPMVEEMAKSNHTIYDVVLGKRPPFAWEHAKARGE